MIDNEKLQNGFFIPFQTQITFWLLGGENIVLTGGGTLDGAGQVGICPNSYRGSNNKKQAWYDAL